MIERRNRSRKMRKKRECSTRRHHCNNKRRSIPTRALNRPRAWTAVAASVLLMGSIVTFSVLFLVDSFSINYNPVLFSPQFPPGKFSSRRSRTVERSTMTTILHYDSQSPRITEAESPGVAPEEGAFGSAAAMAFASATSTLQKQPEPEELRLPDEDEEKEIEKKEENVETEQTTIFPVKATTSNKNKFSSSASPFQKKKQGKTPPPFPAFPVPKTPTNSSSSNAPSSPLPFGSAPRKNSRPNGASSSSPFPVSPQSKQPVPPRSNNNISSSSSTSASSSFGSPPKKGTISPFGSQFGNGYSVAPPGKESSITPPARRKKNTSGTNPKTIPTSSISSPLHKISKPILTTKKQDEEANRSDEGVDNVSPQKSGIPFGTPTKNAGVSSGRPPKGITTGVGPSPFAKSVELKKTNKKTTSSPSSPEGVAAGLPSPFPPNVNSNKNKEAPKNTGFPPFPPNKGIRPQKGWIPPKNGLRKAGGEGLPAQGAKSMGSSPFQSPNKKPEDTTLDPSNRKQSVSFPPARPFGTTSTEAASTPKNMAPPTFGSLSNSDFRPNSKLGGPSNVENKRVRGHGEATTINPDTGSLPDASDDEESKGNTIPINKASFGTTNPLEQKPATPRTTTGPPSFGIPSRKTSTKVGVARKSPFGGFPPKKKVSASAAGSVPGPPFGASVGSVGVEDDGCIDEDCSIRYLSTESSVLPSLVEWKLEMKITGRTLNHPVIPDGELLTTACLDLEGTNGTSSNTTTLVQAGDIVATTKGTRYQLLAPPPVGTSYFPPEAGDELQVDSLKRNFDVEVYNYSTELPYEDQLAFLEELTDTVKLMQAAENGTAMTAANPSNTSSRAVSSSPTKEAPNSLEQFDKDRSSITVNASIPDQEEPYTQAVNPSTNTTCISKVDDETKPIATKQIPTVVASIPIQQQKQQSESLQQPDIRNLLFDQSKEEEEAYFLLQAQEDSKYAKPSNGSFDAATIASASAAVAAVALFGGGTILNEATRRIDASLPPPAKEILESVSAQIQSKSKVVLPYLEEQIRIAETKLEDSKIDDKAKNAWNTVANALNEPPSSSKETVSEKHAESRLDESAKNAWNMVAAKLNEPPPSQSAATTTTPVAPVEAVDDIKPEATAVTENINADVDSSTTAAIVPDEASRPTITTTSAAPIEAADESKSETKIDTENIIIDNDTSKSAAAVPADVSRPTKTTTSAAAAVVPDGSALPSNGATKDINVDIDSSESLASIKSDAVDSSQPTTSSKTTTETTSLPAESKDNAELSSSSSSVSLGSENDQQASEELEPKSPDSMETATSAIEIDPLAPTTAPKATEEESMLPKTGDFPSEASTQLLSSTSSTVNAAEDGAIGGITDKYSEEAWTMVGTEYITEEPTTINKAAVFNEKKLKEPKPPTLMTDENTRMISQQIPLADAYIDANVLESYEEQDLSVEAESEVITGAERIVAEQLEAARLELAKVSEQSEAAENHQRKAFVRPTNIANVDNMRNTRKISPPTFVQNFGGNIVAVVEEPNTNYIRKRVTLPADNAFLNNNFDISPSEEFDKPVPDVIKHAITVEVKETE